MSLVLPHRDLSKAIDELKQIFIDGQLPELERQMT